MALVPGWHVNVLVHPDHEVAYRTALDGLVLHPPLVTPQLKYAGCA